MKVRFADTAEDDLARLHELTQAKESRLGKRLPTTIDEVLQDEF